MTDKNSLPGTETIDFKKYGISRRTIMKAIGASGLIGGMSGSSAALEAKQPDTQVKEVEKESYDPYPVWDNAESYQVTSSDGIQLHVEETGNPDGQAIFLIHGAYQSRLAWDKQMFDGLRDGAIEEYEGLGEEYRLVAMDLRGHGLSDKPEDEDAYGTGLWADDVHAVIEGLDLANPVLAGWSFGGLVIADYLAHYGDEQIAGLNMVGTAASSTEESDEVQDEGPFLEEVNSRGEFVQSMPYDDFSPRDHYYFLGFNVLAPAESIYWIVDHNDILSDISVPVLITHGKEDTIVSLEEERVQTMIENFPNSQTSFYEEVGHLPFWEAPGRYNSELQKFVQSVLNH